jgi:hypothetical protein
MELSQHEDKDLFAALHHEYDKLPDLLHDPEERVKVWRRIRTMTDEIEKRYPVPDYSGDG